MDRLPSNPFTYQPTSFPSGSEPEPSADHPMGESSGVNISKATRKWVFDPQSGGAAEVTSEGETLSKRKCEHSNQSSAAQFESGKFKAGDQAELSFHRFEGGAESAIWELTGLQDEGEVGSGTYGKVYKAKDDDGKLFAVKVSKSQHAHDLMIDPDRGELALLTAPVHPRVASVYSVVVGRKGQPDYALVYRPEQLKGQDLRSLYVAGAITEFAQGRTLLASTLRHEVDKTTLADMVRQLAEGVAFLHSQSLAHRDISSKNVMYSPVDGVKLVDFDAVKKGLRRSSSLVGTFQLLERDCTRDRRGRGYDPMALDLMEMGATLLYCMTSVHLQEFNPATERFDNMDDEPESQRLAANGFANKRPSEQRRLIKNHLTPQFEGVDEAIIDILIDLMHPRPDRRLSAEGLLRRLDNLSQGKTPKGHE